MSHEHNFLKGAAQRYSSRLTVSNINLPVSIGMILNIIFFLEHVHIVYLARMVYLLLTNLCWVTY